MTRDEFIRLAAHMMAQHADLATVWSVISDGSPFTPEIEAFARYVAASEREACAQLCEQEIERVKPVYSVTAENMLKAIRARE